MESEHNEHRGIFRTRDHCRQRRTPNVCLSGPCKRACEIASTFQQRT